MELEKKIYSPWVFKENEREKAEINREIHKELIEKYNVITSMGTIENPEYYDVAIEYEVKYGHWLGTVVTNKPKLSTSELALILDGGNLCFGHGIRGGKIAIHTD